MTRRENIFVSRNNEHKILTLLHVPLCLLFFWLPLTGSVGKCERVSIFCVFTLLRPPFVFGAKSLLYSLHLTVLFNAGGCCGLSSYPFTFMLFICSLQCVHFKTVNTSTSNW